jgi:hypothetical protein
MFLRRYASDHPVYIIDLSADNKMNESGFIPSIFVEALYPRSLIGRNFRTCYDIKKTNKSGTHNKKTEIYEFICYPDESTRSNIYLLDYDCEFLEPVKSHISYVKMPIKIQVVMAYSFNMELISSRLRNNFGVFSFSIRTDMTAGDYVLSNILTMSNHTTKTYGTILSLKKKTWGVEKTLPARLNTNIRCLLSDSDRKQLYGLCDKGDNIDGLIKTFDKYIEKLLLTLMNKSLRHWFRPVNKRIVVT